MNELFISVLNLSLTATYVAIAVMMIRLFLKKAPKIYSYLLWTVVLFRMICPFSFESAISVIPANTEPIPQDIIFVETPVINSGINLIDNAVNNTISNVQITESVNPIQIVVSIGTCIWLAGIVILLAYAVFSYFKTKQSVNTATLVFDNIFKTDNITTPFVIGIIKPKIYIPTGLTEKEFEYIIRHEKIHIRRGDHLIKIVSFIALAIHWFNPVMWVSYFLMAKDMELSCDESVMRKSSEDIRAIYSDSLLSLSVKQSGLPSPLSFGENNVKTRIKNVLRYKKPAFWISIISVIIVLCASVMLACNQVRLEPEELPVTDETEETIVPEESEEIEEIIESSDTITWYADLTHDGNDEKITIELNPIDFIDDEYYKISIYDSNNNLIWSDDTIYIAHAGNKGYFLYDSNGSGEYYMLYWRPWLGGGSADFEYEIFSFDSTGNKITIESDSFFYNTMQTEQPPIEFKGFITKVNSYLEKSFILIDTYNLELLYSTPDNKIGRLYPVHWDWETSLENLLIQYPTILDETAMFEAGNGISTPVDADGIYIPFGYRFQDLDADNIPEAIIRFGPPESEIMFEKIYKLYGDSYELISSEYKHTFYWNSERRLVTAIRREYSNSALYFVDIQNQQMVFSDYIDSKGNDNYNGIKYDDLLGNIDQDLSVTDLDNTLQLIGEIDCSDIVSLARSKVYGD